MLLEFLLQYIPIEEYKRFVQLTQLYQCFCDETRLRILNLLLGQPLCVSQIQEALQTSQVKVSKHLIYLKNQGLVESQQVQNWRLYQLPAKQSFEVREHLECLQKCLEEGKFFREDLARINRVIASGTKIIPKRAPRSKPIAQTEEEITTTLESHLL